MEVRQKKSTLNAMDFRSEARLRGCKYACELYFCLGKIGDVQEEECNNHPGRKINGDSIDLLSRIRRSLISIADTRAWNQKGSKG